MAYYCKHAYRKKGQRNILCGLLERDPYCGHQYFCTNTGRTELTQQAPKCTLAEKHSQKEKGENE